MSYLRKPRYRRTVITSFRLQQRDIEIIKLVYKHRFLSSEHITTLIQGSHQRILRRLQLLFHGGYLDRPIEQIRGYRQFGTMVYGLGNKGADLLTKQFGVWRGKIDWTSKNREVKTVFLEHTLMISNIMVCLELSCRQAGIRIIDLEETPIQGRAAKPLSWSVQIEKNTRFNMVPDKAFGLYFPNSILKRRLYFFLEADRGTMPIRRNNYFTSSYYKKILGYWHSWQRGVFNAFGNIRILTVTTSNKRINSMIGACKDVDARKKGSRMFLFAQSGDFDINNPTRVLERIWYNARDNDMVSLID